MLGVPTKDILKRGHWSKATTFEKYYHEEILIDDEKLQDSVFGKLGKESVAAMTFIFTRDRAYHQY